MSEPGADGSAAVATASGTHPRIAAGPLLRAAAAGLVRWRLGLTVLVVALLTWPVASLLAAPGLDPSWAVGMSLGVSKGLAFGRQLIFSYGPLGLIAQPRAVSPGTLALGVVGAALLEIALAWVLVRALRTRLPLLLAALVAVAALLVVVSCGLPTLDDIAFGLVVLALTAPAARADRAALWLAVLGGAFAAVACLVKLNDGAASAAIIGVGVLGMPRLRASAPLAVGVFVATLVVVWLALGEPIGALGDYLRNGYSVVSGYADAMGYDGLGNTGEWEVLALFVSAAALCVVAWRGLVGGPRRRQVALVVAVLLVHYAVGREMFVRYDLGHAAALALLLPVALMLPWRRGEGTLSVATAALLAAGALAILGSQGIGLGGVVDPFGRASAFFSDVGTTLSPGQAIAQGRYDIQAADAIPLQIASDLNNHCVNVEPTEVAALFAYPQWHWCPTGVMQSYTAYTARLDDIDAGRYADPHGGPDRVLRQAAGTIDGRNPTWDSPAAMLSLLCHFKEIGRGGQWQLLQRVPDRCGAPVPLAVLHGDGQTALTLPPGPPGAVVVARIQGLQVHGVERLKTLFGRAGERELVINDALTYRVIPDTVPNGLVLDVPRNADFLAPFNYDRSVRTLDAEISQRRVPFTITLFGIPIKPFPQVRRSGGRSRTRTGSTAARRRTPIS